MAGLEDEEAQINGVVDVLYIVDGDSTSSSSSSSTDDNDNTKNASSPSSLQETFSELLAEGSDMINDLPFRMVAFHFCYSEHKLRPIMRLIQWMIGQQIRLRFRAHYGKLIVKSSLFF